MGGGLFIEIIAFELFLGLIEFEGGGHEETGLSVEGAAEAWQCVIEFFFYFPEGKLFG
jgi:hypothetical protein